LYGVTVAVLPLLILVSNGGPSALVGDDAVALIASLAGAILVPGVALANVGERGVRRPQQRPPRG